MNKLKQYLLLECGNTVTIEFIKELERRIFSLTAQPFIGIASSNFPDTRSVLISKHNKLGYKIEKNKMMIVDLIDTRQKTTTKKY